jgi:hypothetical protein
MLSLSYAAVAVACSCHAESYAFLAAVADDVALLTGNVFR